MTDFRNFGRSRERLDLCDMRSERERRKEGKGREGGWRGRSLTIAEMI
jgi:hypothetical protein